VSTIGCCDGNVIIIKRWVRARRDDSNSQSVLLIYTLLDQKICRCTASLTCAGHARGGSQRGFIGRRIFHEEESEVVNERRIV
jgi:hypothetical protein